MRLYELTEQYLELLEMAEDETLDPAVIQDTMEGLEGEIEEKADAYAKIIFTLDGNMEILNKEVERLQRRIKTMGNNKEYLKKNLEASMLVTGKKKFKTELFSFGIQKNAPSLDIVDESKIPEAYYVPQEPKLDRKQLLKDVKADQEGTSAYARLKQTESLRIR